MSVTCKRGVGKTTRAPTMERAWFIASTAGVDRYGDVVDQATWALAAYNMNPVIQVDHDWRAEKNVGKASSIGVEGGQLVVEVEWGSSPFAVEIAQKVMDGHLSAVSVGFRSATTVYRDSLPKDDPYYGQRGYLYRDNTLLEVSVVVIPANAEAVLIRRALDDTAPDLADSEYSQPPIAYAKALKAEYPEIWELGGNERGNEAFDLWSRFRDGDRADAVLEWVSEREAWAARHFADGDAFVGDDPEAPTMSNLAGVVAWVKWGVVGQLGWPRMRSLLDEMKEMHEAPTKSISTPDLAEEPVTMETDPFNAFLLSLLAPVAPVDPFDHLYYKGD